MALVDYSDSDASDVEAVPVPQPSSKPSKDTFQKVVDRSNPGKIRVSLPERILKPDKQENGHAAKRIKTGGSGLSDFKSFLPPPKRNGQVLSTSLGRESGVKKGGFGAGVNLKTGAVAGFSREMETSNGAPETTTADINGEEQTGLGTMGTSYSVSTVSEESRQQPTSEVKLVGRPLMFKPLSVARNPAKTKKKQIQASLARSALRERPSVSSSTLQIERLPQGPQVSLFSVSAEPSDLIVSNPNGTYEPIIYQGMTHENQQRPDDSAMEVDLMCEEQTHAPPLSLSSHESGAQSLDDIASDLHLSAADRRQLFGRQKGSKGGTMPSTAKIIIFNTDQEYKHNEELRAAGEQVRHNPVRAIAPGKHSLKQLVNAAASQKEALEESFAKGKSNRAEASNRYGW